MNLSKQVAQFFVERAKTQQMKGKARERAAIEFTIGAAATASIMRGTSSGAYSELSVLAFLVATRGYGELEQVAQS